MGWLRRDKDCIALVVVWALLLQAALLSFASAAHAATLATENVVLCTLRGALIGDPSPGESHRQTDHPCCTMSCRLACGSTGAGILPLALRVPLPASVEAPSPPPRLVEPLAQTSEVTPSQPRAPPRA